MREEEEEEEEWKLCFPVELIQFYVLATPG